MGESDLMIGNGKSQTLVTISERVSRYSITAYMRFKTAQTVGDALITSFKPFAHCVHTFKTDNGK
ncbi:hypothetical protein [Polaromonas vacuolata]|uniref:hypothetical protein n=1 Tax=Polaromonas vacuolata TaxID=37448 RepID=UPI0014570B26|nr:hypothetical protein [Polaromonas vacuolata]